MNILGIDYGKKNIGLAWVDTDLGVILPYGNFEWKVESRKLKELFEKEKVNKIVVGLPLGLDGQENKNTKAVREFVEELKKEVSIPVELVDERFTSKQADRMGDEGVSRDERAAMLILESYLNKQ